MDNTVTVMKSKQATGLWTVVSQSLSISFSELNLHFLHPFLFAAPFSNLSIIFFVLDPLKFFSSQTMLRPGVGCRS